MIFTCKNNNYKWFHAIVVAICCRRVIHFVAKNHVENVNNGYSITVITVTSHRFDEQLEFENGL